MNLVAFVIEVHDVLERGGLAHAFGGALALAHVAEPRGTVDVDVNVFAPSKTPTPPSRSSPVSTSGRKRRRGCGQMYPRIARLRTLLRDERLGP